MKEKKIKVNNRKNNKKFIIIGIIAIILIMIIISIVIVKKVNSQKVELRLKAEPVSYYRTSSNYFVHNNKFYYYSIDDENRGRIFSMDFDGENNQLVSASEFLKTPNFLFVYENTVYCTTVTKTGKIIIKVNLETGEMDNAYDGELEFLPNTIKDGTIQAIKNSDSDEGDNTQLEMCVLNLNTHKITSETKVELEEKKDNIVVDNNEDAYYTKENKLYKMNLTTGEIEELDEIEGLEECSGIKVIGNKLVLDFDSNLISKYTFRKVIVYDLENKTYETYDNLRHSDVDYDEKVLYLVNDSYGVSRVEL